LPEAWQTAVCEYELPGPKARQGRPPEATDTPALPAIGVVILGCAALVKAPWQLAPAVLGVVEPAHVSSWLCVLLKQRYC
jgi:hypothetical protein